MEPKWIPVEEIAAPFRLSDAVPHNGARITGSGPVAIFTDVPQWSYAAAFRLRAKTSQSRAEGAPLLIQVDTTVESGRIGFLFVADDLQTVLSDTAERSPQDGTSVAEILVNPAPDSGWLMVRNHAAGGTPSKCHVRGIRAFRGTSAHHWLQVPETLIPIAFRKPAEARQALSALACERFGPDAKIGQNVSLSFSSRVLAVPHQSMWNGPKDQVVVKSIGDLVDRLPSYSPEGLRKHVGYLDREYMGKYLRQTGIRVAQLIDRLDAMGLKPGSRILEIGTLFGAFALPLSRLGYRVTAIDRYQAFDGALDAYVDLMQAEGIEVIPVTRETESQAMSRLSAFDCTIAMAVIEHVPHTPRHFLEAIRERTVPGGIIALDTPNLTRFWNRRKLAQDESIFQDLALQYECEIPYEGHHREYTAQEMRWLLNRIGCQEVSIDLFDYNMLQFDRIDGPHLECLSMILSDPAYADTILACGRRV
jgi:2-polyprenyl-3-methyl-5-hydroxy-6-metoxy-1,4-benzoquinol methylase